MQILLDLLDERIQVFDSNTLHEVQVAVVALDHAAEDIPQGDEDAGDFVAFDVDDVLEEQLAVASVEEGGVDEVVV